MGKAIRCLACKAWYNGSIYANCPYCAEEAKKVKTDAKTEETGKQKGILGLVGKKIKSTSKSVRSSEEEVKSAETMDQVSPDDKKETGSKIGRELVPATVPCEESAGHGGSVQPEISNTVPIGKNMKVPQTEPIDSSDGASKPAMSLSQAISRSGRTVGKYISNSGGESIAPVVGWLVGVKGSYYGQSFNLKSGRNKIGRSHEMDVKLMNDESVSRTSVAIIIFDAKGGEFSILPGESDSLCYVSDSALYERRILNGYEEIEFGDKSLNKYIFVPFCGKQFQWSSYSNDQPQQ